MGPDLLSLARAGDEDAFGELVASYRHELLVHCYRILGSLQDAEDVLQETLLSAWRGLDGFEERSSVRTWLYRIATNRSLDAVRANARRDDPMTTRINGLVPPPPTHHGEVPWLTPYPDDLLDLPDPTPGPEAVVELHEATSLAFVTALQLLPPKQRAVLILRDVLGYRATEAAEVLDTSVESVTSALKRARATLDSDETLAERRAQPPAPAAGSPEERRLIEAYVDAFTTHDVDKLVAHPERGRLAEDAAAPSRVPRPRRRCRLLPGRSFTRRAAGSGSSTPGPTAAQPAGSTPTTRRPTPGGRPAWSWWSSRATASPSSPASRSA